MKGREQEKEAQRKGRTERRGSIYTVHTVNMFPKCKEYSEK